MNVPTDRQYTAEHEWILIDGDVARVGVTEYAADALGDVVFIDLPAVGAVLTAGEACGEIESTKSVSELFAPADGTVVEVNDAVTDTPEVVNTDPFGAGWLFTMRVDGSPALLEPAAYAAMTSGQTL
jgi:glycine cleavage system H protein